jgi:RNA polymerase sigma factor for flagellar operon FliA
LYKLLEELRDSGLHLAAFIVERDFKNALDFHDKDDLIGYAIIGILEAARKFDDTKGVSFVTFATKKAKQRIVDFIRQKRNQRIASIEDVPNYESHSLRVFQ